MEHFVRNVNISVFQCKTFFAKMLSVDFALNYGTPVSPLKFAPPRTPILLSESLGYLDPLDN